MAKLTVVGSSNTDMVIRTARFPVPGETIIGGEFFMFPGGKGGNQAVAAARMGAEVSFITSLGDDLFGQNALKGYSEEGILTDGSVVHTDIPTGVAMITVNKEGENEIVVAPGANQHLNRSHLQSARESIINNGMVLTQLETPIEVVNFLAGFCREHDLRLIINPAPAQALPDETLKDLYLITPNETETEILTGMAVTDERSGARAASVLLKKGVENVIITMGKRGAFFMNKETHFSIIPPKVQAIDTTAAGDVFNGAIAVVLAEGMDWKAGIDLACKAAALSVTRMGAQTSAPYRKEIYKMF